MNTSDAKQLRSIIKEEVAGVVQTQLEPIKKDLQGLRSDVDSIKDSVNVVKKEVKELSENVDAARGDIESLHMDVKGIREKESLFHSRNKQSFPFCFAKT